MGLFSKLLKKINKSSEKSDNIKFISSEIEQEDEDEITAVISSILAFWDEEETVAVIAASIAVIL